MKEIIRTVMNFWRNLNVCLMFILRSAYSNFHSFYYEAHLLVYPFKILIHYLHQVLMKFTCSTCTLIFDDIFYCCRLLSLIPWNIELSDNDIKSPYIYSSWWKLFIKWKNTNTINAQGDCEQKYRLQYLSRSNFDAVVL